jgi:hypothetical protein
VVADLEHGLRPHDVLAAHPVPVHLLLSAGLVEGSQVAGACREPSVGHQARHLLRGVRPVEVEEDVPDVEGSGDVRVKMGQEAEKRVVLVRDQELIQVLETGSSL